MTDYDRLEATLRQQHEARQLPAEMAESVRWNQALHSRKQQAYTLEWLRQMPAEERAGAVAMLDEWGAQAEAENADRELLRAEYGDQPWLED